MATPRSHHVTKTRAEQEDYVSSLVQSAPQPTIETLPDSDQTDTIIPQPEKTGSLAPTARQVKQVNKFFSYFSDNSPAIFIAVFGLIAVALATFIFYVNNTTLGLNREVGELKILMDSYRSQLQRMDASIDKLNDRLQRTDERLYERSNQPAKTRR